MPTTITVNGQGGAKTAGDAKPAGYSSPAPLELHGDQWGLYQVDLKIRVEDQS